MPNVARPDKPAEEEGGPKQKADSVRSGWRSKTCAALIELTPSGTRFIRNRYKTATVDQNGNGHQRADGR
jgi:hypothetical protein